MKVFIRFFQIFSLFVGTLLAETVLPLPQLNKPNFITAGEGWLCIAEESSPVHLFRIEGNSVKFAASFGREGQGPGEFNWIHRLRILEDGLEIPTKNRYYRFDFNGKLTEERKVLIPVLKNQIYKLGQVYAAKVYDWDQKHMVNTIAIYDSVFKLMKKIGKLEVKNWLSHYNPAPDLFSLTVVGDLVYICSSTARESTVETFDVHGNPLKKISLPLKSCPVTESLKEALIKPLRDMTESEEEWLEFSKRISFPDLTPGVKEIFIQEGQMICQSYRRRGELAEYAFFDLSGKELKRTLLKYFDRDPNGRMHCFHQGKLVYLVDNADQEVWELHIEDAY